MCQRVQTLTASSLSTMSLPSAAFLGLPAAADAILFFLAGPAEGCTHTRFNMAASAGTSKRLQQPTLLEAPWAFLGGAEDLGMASAAGGGALEASFLSPPPPNFFPPGSSTLSAHSLI